MPTQFTIANTGRAAGSQLDAGNFVSEIWSRKLNAKYYSKTFLMSICNTNWEGEIKKQGSKVMIRQRPDVTVGDWTVNGTITYQDLDDPMIELAIDKAKYFAFKLDDVDEAQQDIKILNESTEDASAKMAIHIETDVLANVYGDATTSQTEIQVTKDNVLDWIIDQGTALDELDIPTEGRFMVIPPWIGGMIKKSELKGANVTGDAVSIARNGRLGIVDRFELFVSNLIANDGTTYNPIAGTKAAISYASQVNKVEPVRLESTFGDAVRGLNVYGYKTVYPDALVHAPCRQIAMP